MKKLKDYFKRLFKGEINTPEDCEQRKKDIKKFLIGSAILLGITLLCQILISDSFGMLNMIGGFGLIIGAFLMLVVKNIEKRFKFLTCNKCKTVANITTDEEFEQLVHYEILDIKPHFDKLYTLDDDKKPGFYKELRVSAHITVKIGLALKCANCGEEKLGYFSIVPFKCQISQRDVPVSVSADYVTAWTDRIGEVLNEWLDEDNEYDIPVTVTSIYHPNYENRGKPGCDGAREEYKGVTITYSRGIDEMVDGYFLRKELNYTINELETKEEAQEEPKEEQKN
ncbi:MAG: hypothetical protein IJF11_03990 [Clostridia bacterium]|nr:hypothetical protein [Clostridia bacterium]